MAQEPENDARLAFDREKWAEERDLRLKGLELDREKCAGDKELRARELGLKAQAQATTDAALELKRLELRQSRWTNPLTVAILTAAAVGAGNIWVTKNNSDLQQALEVGKEDLALILETVKGAGTDAEKASTNLQFLVAAHLIADPQQVSLLQTYLATTTTARHEVGPPPSAGAVHTLSTPQVNGTFVDICSGGGPGNNDCSPTGQRVAATQVCVANGFKQAADFSVRGKQGAALHWNGTAFQLLPSGAVFGSITCTS